MVTQASMGPIVDRTRDHLSSSDVAIIQPHPRLCVPALEDHSGGAHPLAATPGMDHRDVFPVDTVIPAGAVTRTAFLDPDPRRWP